MADLGEFAGLVRDALEDRHDAGETASLGWLQETCGLGRGDLEAALGELCEAGVAVEESPGEWRLPFDDEVREQRQPTTKPEEREPDEPGERFRPLGASDARPLSEVPIEARTAVAGTRALGGGEVALTAAMAEALSAETLGELVKAGIAEAGEQGREFVFVVLP